ncbi:MAG: hypothetical protein ACYS9X_31160, partial [Planctomycetota bacterium]
MSLDRAREILGAILARIFGSQNIKILRRLEPEVARVNVLEPEMAALSDSELAGKTGEFRARFADGMKERGVPGMREEIEKLRGEGRPQEADDVNKRIVRHTNEVLDEILPEA